MVRPTLKLDLIDPDARDSEDDPLPPAEILLAQIDLVVPDNAPLDFDTITIDNSTRPYLLHTQLIQELYDIPDLTGEGGAAAPDQEVREWADYRRRQPPDYEALDSHQPGPESGSQRQH